MSDKLKINFSLLKTFCRFLLVFLTLVMIALPTSPVWLRSKNRNVEADKSAEWLGLQPLTKIVVSYDVGEKGRFV